MNPRNRLTPTSPWTGATAMIDPPRPPAYRVGEPFVRGRNRWPEGAEYSHGRAGHELTLFVAAPSAASIDGVRRGGARFALSEAGPVFYLAYRFEGAPAWADVPYCWHLQHRETRATPPADDAAPARRRALLWVSLVGADDGLIHAQRGLTLSPEFTRELHRAIRAQACAAFDPTACVLAVAEIGRERPDAARRLTAAHAWTVGNA